MDAIERVAKRELGADVVQQVNGSIDQPAGMNLLGIKDTKAWSDGWLAKLREDQRRCGADIALIVSHALPKHVEHFDLVDGVGWPTRVALSAVAVLAAPVLD